MVDASRTLSIIFKDEYEAENTVLIFPHSDGKKVWLQIASDWSKEKHEALGFAVSNTDARRIGEMFIRLADEQSV